MKPGKLFEIVILLFVLSLGWPSATAGQIPSGPRAVALSCSFSIAPSIAQAPASGGTGTVAVATTSDCLWTASSNVTWITIFFGATGAGNGSVTYSVTVNTGTSPRTGTLTIAGQTFTLAQAGSPSGQGPNLLVNGSFEQPGGGEKRGLGLNSTYITGWVVTRDTVDYFGGTYACSDGTYCIDLNGDPGYGAIAQTFATIPGDPYTVTFDLAGNPDGPPLTKRVRVMAAGQQADFNFEVLGRTRANMGWITLSWSFVANSTVTTLQFQSLDTTGGSYGPMIDNVRVLGTSSGCTYTVTPTTQSLSADGGSLTINVVVAAGCVWTATSNDPWITISSGASGVGVGTVTLLVAPNNVGTNRTGSVTIAGVPVVVLQSTTPGGCVYNVSPSGFSFPADGTTSGWIAVSTTANCGWSATTSVPWITITSGPGGAGNGSVSFTVASNPGAPRSGAITVARQVVTVNQDTGCTYTLTPSASSIPAGGTTSGSIVVATASICSWTAATAVPWISITSGASGTGNGTVSYTVAANTGADRSAAITVVNQAHTVNQAAGAGILPAINAGGVVSAADYSASLAPGSIFSLFGNNLAFVTRGAPGIPLPTSLEGVSVEILDGARVLTAPLFFISPGQINAQMPFDIASSSVQVRVRTATGPSDTQAVSLLPRAPRLFTKTLDGKGEAILVHADFSAVSAAVPAIPSETVILFLTGLGTVSPSVPAGQAGGDGGSGGPLSRVGDEVIVIVQGLEARQAKVSFAGLAPYFVGLYQVNFQVPDCTAAATPSLKVRVAQQESQAGVTFACRSN